MLVHTSKEKVSGLKRYPWSPWPASTIDFNNPAGGSYDLWIGSYASGKFVSGSLYVTANSGNHP